MRKYKKIGQTVLLVGITGGLAGIAACSNKLTLRHDQKTVGSPEYREDIAECKLYADSAATITIVAGHGAERNLDEWTRHYYDCLGDKGWYVVDRDGKRIDTGKGDSDTIHSLESEIPSSIEPPAE